MILLVVAGGANTFKTILETLEKGRSVVVLADSGGAATDLHEYFEHRVLPVNKLEPSDAQACHAHRQRRPSRPI
jgi:hypothetical protein